MPWRATLCPCTGSRLADSSKFGRRGFAKIGDLEEIDLIITDSDISPKDVKRIHDLGIDLVIAQ